MSFKMYNPGYKLAIFIHYSNSAFFDIVAAAEIDYHLLEKYFKHPSKLHLCCIIYANKTAILSGAFGVRMGELCHDNLKIHHLMEMVKMIKL